METKHRYLHEKIRSDLTEKMVFVGGPRQVGKTTLSKNIADTDFKDAQYFSWDKRQHREELLTETFSAEADLLILDEIHKYTHWKNYVKGLYDTRPESQSLLITGSARMDVYRRGGDSLMGRYHYYRLHPFSLAEMMKNCNNTVPFSQLEFFKSSVESQNALEDLYEYGGFPEPLLKNNRRTLRRWQNQRIERLVKEDIRDGEFIRDLSSLQILAETLIHRASTRLSINSLRGSLQTSHKTLSHWLDILERFYYHYRIYPFAKKPIRSLLKEPKLYLWDWSEIPDEGRKFENLIASHLLKFTHYLLDAEGYKTELYYLRDSDGREVDFLVTKDKKPWFAVEVKLQDEAPSKHLQYFAKRLHIPQLFQVIKKTGVDKKAADIRVMSADKFLSALV